MPALKTIVLNLKDKEKVIIPISTSKGKSFNFDGISINNDVQTIRLEFEKKADITYDVVNTRQAIHRKDVTKKAFDSYVKRRIKKQKDLS